MITVTNLAIKLKKKVLYKDVNLKFTSGNIYVSMALSVLTVPVSQHSSVQSAESWNPTKEQLSWEPANDCRYWSRTTSNTTTIP